MASLKTLISTKIHSAQSEAAKKYAAHVLITQDRSIDKQDAVNELIALGASVALPDDVLDTLDLEIPTKPKSTGKSK